MRNRIAVVTLVSACIAAPLGAMAQTVGLGPPTMPVDQVRDIAVMNGVIAIRKIELYDGKWHVEGRDQSGMRVEMQIDPRTGGIAHLERFD
jgi:Peptidase propeptide and YPEB domain